MCRKKLKKFGLFGITILFCLTAIIFDSLLIKASNLNKKTTIYVVGNPNLYPIEYYDIEEKIFKGVIPKLLEEFSSRGTYEIKYITKNIKDERLKKYQNKQVDLISGCVASDSFPEKLWQSGIPILRIERDGVEEEYRILITDLADSNLKKELIQFFESLTTEHINGLMLAEAKQKVTIPLIVILIIAFVIVVIAIGIAYKIRNNRKKNFLLEKKIKTDRVTGLGNYIYLEERYEQFIQNENRILYSLIYFYIDLDRIKKIGDSEEIKEFLDYTARILKEHTVYADILARVTEEGFVVLKYAENPKEVSQFVQAVLEKIKEYSALYAKFFLTDAYAGIYRLKKFDPDLPTILFNAEQSSQYAHKNGLGYAECSEEILNLYEEEKLLRKLVHMAFENEEFVLYLQFYVDTVQHKIVGAEALSRWNNPEKGLLMPSRYVALLEREKLVAQLDYYVLERVCRFLQNLHLKKQEEFFISCNFSRSVFAEADFAERCISIIEKYDFPRELLILELTENSTWKDSEKIDQNAVRMKEYGVSIILDEFGEYNSFLDLWTNYFDGVKIDKKLIDNLESEKGEVIVKTIVEMAHQLGMTVLAQGVETKEQVQKLTNMQCDVIQGFYFYKPFPLYEANKYMEQKKERFFRGGVKQYEANAAKEIDQDYYNLYVVNSGSQ